MYFQELENMKKSLSSSQKYKEMELPIIFSAINALDFWLASRSYNYRIRLNPLQFSNDSGLSGEVSMNLFELCLEYNILTRHFELWSEDGLECLIKSEKYEGISSKKRLYNCRTDDYEDVNLESIQIWYKINVMPRRFENFEEVKSKKIIAPPLSLENVSNSKEMSDCFLSLVSRD